MEQTPYTVSLQTTGGAANSRIDELITKFKEWLAGQGNLPELRLTFSTAEQYPLMMEEVARFLDECLNIEDGIQVEWNHETDSTLGAEIRLDVAV